MATDTRDFDRVVLLDVQGLFGGRELWLDSDGSAWARVVGPPAPGQAQLPERLLAFTVPAPDMEELARRLAENDPAGMRIPDRPGVPDEARPIVCVQRGEDLRAVAKWAGDAHAEFDAIYRFLIRLVGRAVEAGGEEASWDGEAPPGFPDRRTIRDLSG